MGGWRNALGSGPEAGPRPQAVSDQTQASGPPWCCPCRLRTGAVLPVFSEVPQGRPAMLDGRPASRTLSSYFEKLIPTLHTAESEAQGQVSSNAPAPF